MSIKDRMEVGQAWRGGTGRSFKITGLGEDQFLSRVDGSDEGSFYYYAAERDWTLTHDSDGNPVCEFCGDWNRCLAETRMVPEPGSMNYYCTREKGHNGDHVACTDINHHNINQWPKEEVVDPEQAERVEREKPKGVVKVKVCQSFYEVPTHQNSSVRGSAMDHKDYIGWEDDMGILRGLFRRKDDNCGTYTFLSSEQWESGEWEVVKPVKLWFEENK